MIKMENINSGSNLYRRYIIDSILEKAHTYSAFKKLVAAINICSWGWLACATPIYYTEGGCDIVTPLVVTIIISIINCLLPTTQFFAETMVINNKDIVDVDKLDVVNEVKYELKMKF